METKVNIHLLPTDKESNIHLNSKNELEYIKISRKRLITESQQIYLTLPQSDLEISKIGIGDWCIDPTFYVGQIIMKHEEECFYSPHKSGGSVTTPWKRNLGNRLEKIIACTDTSLGRIKDEKLAGSEYLGIGVAQIQQSFIEHYISEYNKGNVLKSVEVELEEFNTIINGKELVPRGEILLKLTPDNEVVVSIPEEKVYTKQQVRDLCKVSFEMYMSDDSLDDDELRIKWSKWLEENL